ncbi:Sister chromatid cohesion protein isoform 2 [Actinidia chinensis var. chinensis]|uniref:Sister chromatid cohesion protein isoform 1 n=1 Tax=Actinidia chinensis var. chinensis TaxID=1590841 RepID=A0A2R6QPU0_ACTCC|nr:Sister chromatid cohesion protein isoform 1 [Actinidia chinensis var. chinensis]PSS11948.1 Sister chromatid cohesion protein isoform 2 [Actinidia chinensis var. chinensis]
MEMETEQPLSTCRGAEAVLNLKPASSVSIAYHSLFGPHDDLVLLELDEKLLPDVLHNRVALRGQPDEDAVLCTTSKTYAIKYVGTSNTVLLIAPSDQPLLCGNAQDFDEKDRFFCRKFGGFVSYYLYVICGSTLCIL